MNSIENRVAKLEERVSVSADGRCHCAIGNIDVRTYFGPKGNLSGMASHDAADADTRPPDTCQECGGQKKIIKFIYADMESVAAGR
jgi:hypothetical protein